mmetsp:Transcript_10419/g.17032  ORF Transcript_10419/g.17032 Transcript_10419/m.17032 type:complete len:346 (-) Transcript_10419:663-1700(-)|eukprot:CAMPEP_0184643392 /NCGR_PEP_ID=MMETSP0308-20130426/232_1 /TAXON_ID=38269 /ORGANISM="Gloeochaete witrockiana, Strain SAG 46.84" /LENGTH=345 /DNA_ID=CAMNT_0027071307 /DNA_START=73 /DNA_END=1110 /DNA_ORIENTATION=+
MKEAQRVLPRSRSVREGSWDEELRPSRQWWPSDEVVVRGLMLGARQAGMPAAIRLTPAPSKKRVKFTPERTESPTVPTASVEIPLPSTPQAVANTNDGSGTPKRKKRKTSKWPLKSELISPSTPPTINQDIFSMDSLSYFPANWSFDDIGSHMNGKLPMPYGPRGSQGDPLPFDEKVALVSDFIATRKAMPKASDKDSKGNPVGRWAWAFIRNYRSGELRKERQEALQKISGWSWQLQGGTLVRRNFDEMLKYITAWMETTKCMPHSKTVKTDEGIPIGVYADRWVRQFREGKLHRDRQELLEKLVGWKWEMPGQVYHSPVSKASENVPNSGLGDEDEGFEDETT